jgi:hypothetical protein
MRTGWEREKLKTTIVPAEAGTHGRPRPANLKHLVLMGPDFRRDDEERRSGGDISPP